MANGLYVEIGHTSHLRNVKINGVDLTGLLGGT